MLQAIKEAERQNMPFDALFPHQYAIRVDRTPTPEGWIGEEIGGFRLHRSPRLPRSKPETNAFGVEIIVLGIAVDDGVLVSDTTKLPFGPASDWNAIERWAERLAGRFIALCRLGDDHRIYFDPSLELSCFYNPVTGNIGSSPYMALDRPMQTGRYIDSQDVISGTANFALGITGDRDLRLARPNHALCLNRYHLIRHWPRVADVAAGHDGDPDSTAFEIATRLGATFGALVQSYDALVPVTGGQDSRALIASGRDHLGHVKAFFTHRTNYMTALDCLIAEQLGQALGFEVALLDGVRLSESEDLSHRVKQEQDLFTLRTGRHCSVPGHHELATREHLPDGQILLRGNVMDLNRANQWRGQSSFRLAHMVRRMRLRAPEGIAPATYWGREAGTWLDNLPDEAIPFAYDISFLENILPNTMGAMLNGITSYFTLNPFNDRHLISRSMRVPPALRREGALNAAIIKATVPGLAEIAYTQGIKRSPEARRAAEALFPDPETATTDGA
ncbi:hypothetical protein [Ruegeria sp.]|uniref:hypothetical protein n=1 Tax=Ruegeria sp. TaxID=1879320 RepID=UPI00230FB7C1|nr:hypothetical protein [Ruegeria sp.]MDA7963813.1 hypothetical protein [Ruegeria sp.]